VEKSFTVHLAKIKMVVDELYQPRIEPIIFLCERSLATALNFQPAEYGLVMKVWSFEDGDKILDHRIAVTGALKPPPSIKLTELVGREPVLYFGS
jgi:hypothetical protein